MWTVIAQMDPDDMMRWGRHGNGSNWWWIVGLLLLLVIVGLAAWLVFRATSQRNATPAAPVGPPVASAEQLLAERLARGEIDPAEYRERLTALRGG